MTNEELAIKIDNLSDIVANLAKTMDERFEQIDQRFKQIDERFEQIDQRFKQIDERFEQIDRRFEQVDERFEQIDEQLADIRKDHKTLVDIVKDMDLAADERFQELKAGQAELAAKRAYGPTLLSFAASYIMSLAAARW